MIINFTPCDLELTKDICVKPSIGGELVNVSVCLKNLHPNKCLMVGVLICYQCKPYAFISKEINTCEYFLCQNACCVKEILIDFDFIMPCNICTNDISTRIIAHYLC